MRVSILGLGYVGVVSAACLARRGHTVIGVDPNAQKVDLIARGLPPVVEAGLGELVQDGVARGRLFATSDATRAVLETDLSLVCVGTPSRDNGELRTEFLERACEEIGQALAAKAGRHVVVVRSTVLPGTTQRLLLPVLERASGKRAGRDFGVCVNPEFLREGTAVHDFDHPPKTVIGESDAESGDLAASLYDQIDAPLIRVDVPIAEMAKYVDNAWHALKIGFANEIGAIAKASGIDSHRVMEIFCADTKLNISSAYLRPGQAFGGSCLPKDLRALNFRARGLDLEVPILQSVLPSNRLHLERALKLITDKGKKRVGILGLAFKAGTDDLRESPMVELVERLIGKGYDVRIYDRSVSIARLVGANRDYILNHIPHISQLLVEDMDEVLGHADVVVAGNGDPEFRSVPDMLKPGQKLVDLVRLASGSSGRDDYDGICW